MTISHPRRWAVAILFCLAPLTATAAEPEAIQKALKTKTNLEFSDTPLKDVIKFISTLHRIPVMADVKALEAAGIAVDTPITVKAKNEELGTALTRALGPAKLTWVIRNKVLLITTQTAAKQEHLEARVYKLTRDVELRRRIASIMTTVAPESWANVGGPGDAVGLPPGLIVIVQSPLVHREIAAKFAKSLKPVGAEQPVDAAKLKGTEKALASATTMQFVETPLTDVAKFLGTLHRTKVRLDADSLDDAGIAADTPVSIQIRGVSLASGLSLLLAQIDGGLTWIADDKGVTITTIETAKSKLVTHTYDVRAILGRDMDDLIEAVQVTVAPADWEDVGGEGVINPGAKRGTLLVRQSEPVHRQLRQLFAHLREARKKKGTSGER